LRQKVRQEIFFGRFIDDYAAFHDVVAFSYAFATFYYAFYALANAYHVLDVDTHAVVFGPSTNACGESIYDAAVD
tara:strand:+ start:453 stop:677 length:225 start_codon:yes stop_codon:yes gene_type:complete